MKFLLSLVFLSHVAIAQVSNNIDKDANSNSTNKEYYYILNTSGDSSYNSYLIANTDSIGFSIKASVPFLIVPFHNTNKYIYKVLEDINEYYTEEGSDRMDSVPFYKSYTYPFISKNIRSVDSMINFMTTYKADILKGGNQDWSWDRSTYFDITYILDSIIQIDASYGGYEGGAHPNQSHYTYLLTQNQYFKSYYNKNEGILYLDSISKNIDGNYFGLNKSEIDSIKRVLYLKGYGNYFDDLWTEDSESKPFYIHDYDSIDIEKLRTNYPSEYEVNIDNINYRIERNGGMYDLIAEAFAPAPYFASGDYQFTVSCFVKSLDKSFDSFFQDKLYLNEIRKYDRNVKDFYIDEVNNLLIIYTINKINSEEQNIILKFINLNEKSNPTYYEFYNSNLKILSLKNISKQSYLELIKEITTSKYCDLNN